MIDDLCDSGLTLLSVRDKLLEAGAASVKSVVLLDKRARRKVGAAGLNQGAASVAWLPLVGGPSLGTGVTFVRSWDGQCSTEPAQCASVDWSGSSCSPCSGFMLAAHCT